MNSPELRDYIGFGDPRTFSEVLGQFPHLRADALAEVIGDLTPDETGKAVIADSRLATDYARVLTNDQAHAVLRRNRVFFSHAR